MPLRNLSTHQEGYQAGRVHMIEATRRDILAGLGASALVLPFVTLERPSAPFRPSGWIAIFTDGRIEVIIDKADMGQAIHHGFKSIIAHELGAAWADIKLQALPQSPHKWHRRMHTGGSRSIRESAIIWQTAAAQARHMLTLAAARQWDVNPNDCTMQDSMVIHEEAGHRLPFKKLVESAARLSIPNDPKLRGVTNIKTYPREDLQAKVSGGITYGIDVDLPNMRYAVIARSPHPEGRLAGFDKGAAMMLAGVEDIVEVHGKHGVRPGVAVIAQSFWAAIKARRILNPKWDNPHTTDDDVEAALIQAAGQGAFQARYFVPYLAHAPLEPMNCTAWLKAGILHIWAPTQTHTDAQKIAARISGLALDNIVVHALPLGGAFGRRLVNDYVIEAVTLAMRSPHPIKLIWTREDDMAMGLYRPAALGQMSATLTPNGQIQKWRARLVAQSVPKYQGRTFENGIDHISLRGLDPLPYKIENAETAHVVVDLPTPPHYWRSVAYSHNCFFIESFMDELAHKAGMDPLAFRLQHIKDQRLRTVALKAAEHARWTSPAADGHARGLALGFVFGTALAQIVEISTPSGGEIHVHKVTSVVGCGQVFSKDDVKAQIEGGAIFGLTAALYGRIDLDKGEVVQSNFYDYPLLRFSETPEFETILIPSDAAPGGIGEVGTPLIAPAVANALFKLTGQRVRKLPLLG